MRVSAIGLTALITSLASVAGAAYPWGPAITTGDTGQESAWSRVRFDPTNSNTIWAATADLPDPFAGGAPPAANGIFRSLNGGASWSQMASGALDRDYHILDFTICPSNPQVMYVSTLHRGVFKSTNGGTNWTAKNNGLTHKGSGFPNGSWGALSIAVDHDDPNRAYCAVAQLGALDIFNLAPDHPGFYVTTNGGNSWTANNAGLPPREDGILDLLSTTSVVASLGVAGDGTLYAGILQAEANIKVLVGTKATADTKVFRNSNKGGGSWVDVSAGLPPVTQNSTSFGSLARIAASATVITVAEAGQGHAVFTSSLAFGIDVSLNKQIMKSKGKGLFALAPGASSWIPRNGSGAQKLPVVNDFVNEDAINAAPPAVMPGNPYTALTGVVASDTAMPNASKVWATLDAGGSWLKSWGDSGLDVSPTLGQSECNPIFMDIAPNGRRAVVAVTWTDPDSVLSSRSNDDGVYVVPAP